MLSLPAKTKFYVIAAIALSACAGAATVPSQKAGMVEFYGSQKSIFETGKAEAKVPVGAMSGEAASFGVGAVADLDGEITVFEGKPYVTQVRGEAITLDHRGEHAAVFAVWTKNTKWQSEPVPAEVKTYLDLQRFVKARAAAAGVDVSQPFPFLLTGTPNAVTWHINVNRTAGKPIDRDLFKKSKAMYTLKNEAVDIVGFHSESHPGVFISAYAPAIKEEGVKNAMHIHLVSRDGKSAGHIDDITLSGNMVLKLPAK
jgi:acetolactate decarboxylase